MRGGPCLTAKGTLDHRSIPRDFTEAKAVAMVQVFTS